MTADLEKSYSYCRKIVLTRARNFSYAFVLLEKPKRDALCALYTFDRFCDDMSDGPERYGYSSPRQAIEDWRRQLDAALAGTPHDHPVWPAFCDSVERFGIPHQYFYDMIDGVSSDLDRRRFETFEDLYQYCYRVASVVGLSIIHVFGFETREAIPLAEKCGVAFQLTNILRDVREDADMGRIYLPLEDLRRFAVRPESLTGGTTDNGFRELMAFEADRAAAYYAGSEPLVGMVHKNSQGALWTLIRIYSRLLERIRESDYNVLHERVRVPTWEKCRIVLQGMLGRLGAGARTRPPSH